MSRLLVFYEDCWRDILKGVMFPRQKNNSELFRQRDLDDLDTGTKLGISRLS